MLSDLRYALRLLRKGPGFAAVAIVTLSLGIGITTTTFSWVRAILFARLPVEAPEAGGVTSTRSSSAWLRHGLIAGEVALATALLIVAGVFIRTGIALMHQNPGFDAANVLTARIVLPATSYAGPERAAVFYEQSIAGLRQRAGIVDAAATTRLPLAGGAANPNRAVDVEGRPATGDDRPWAIDLVITPAYFATLRIPIVRGRAFSEADRSGAAPVVIVTEAFASRYLPLRHAVRIDPITALRAE